MLGRRMTFSGDDNTTIRWSWGNRSCGSFTGEMAGEKMLRTGACQWPREPRCVHGHAVGLV